MNWRNYLLLGIIGWGVLLIVAFFQKSPGYIDADYYYAGGLQLVKGNGFSEPYLWNYLDDPSSLPHPSHAYWMPFASLLAATGGWFFRSTSWMAGRSGFLFIAALIPPLTAALSWTFNRRRDLAMLSGFLAIFPVFYLPYLPITDTFGIYMVLGSLFFLILGKKFSALHSILLGVVTGLMHLTRTDGFLWLLIALFISPFFLFHTKKPRISTLLILFTGTLSGYLLVMLPWFIRNISTFGIPFAPGGSKMLWLTSYDQIFAYPSTQVNFTTWFHSGIPAILKNRLWALGINLERSIAEQGEIFLIPMIGLGIWHFRKDYRVKIGAVAWLATFIIMSIVFPFAGARGGFFHSSAAFQPLWWTLAPAGLEHLIAWVGRKRGWKLNQATKVFQPALVLLGVFLSGVIIVSRVIGSGDDLIWNQEQVTYSQIHRSLNSKGMSEEDIVMVANPPGFYLASGNPAVAVPYGDIINLLQVALKFNVDYLILEKSSLPIGVMAVYEHPDSQKTLHYLGEISEAHLYEVQH